MDYINEIWKGITEYYEMFRDWYRNRKWYHMIGYIVETSGDNYVGKIAELSKLYKSQDTEQQKIGHKTQFEKNLRELIKASIGVNGELTVKTLGDYVEGLEYDNRSKEEIRKILLLFNICSLELLEKQTDARFPFDKYKDNRGSWDIEHINAVADDRPNDTYDRADGSNACLVWLQNVKKAPYISDVKMPDGTEVLKLIDKVIDGKLYLPQNEQGTATFNSIYDRIIEYYSESGNVNNNSIANLTLLDSLTNRSYKNDIFPLKRIAFEEIELSGPAYPEGYLREQYGDYMRFPRSGILHHDGGRGPLETWAKRSGMDMEEVIRTLEGMIQRI